MAYENAGIVSEVSEKEFDGRNGIVLLYSFQIEGNRRWFRTGTIDPPIKEGDYVEFQNDDKGNVDLDSLEVKDPPARPARGGRGGSGGGRSNGRAAGGGGGGQRSGGRSGGGGRSAGGSAGAGGQTRDGYWAEKEARDIQRDERYQTVDIPRMSHSASRAAAVQLVAAAITAGALPLPAKKADALEAVLAYTDQVTNRFFLDAMHSHETLEELENGPDVSNSVPDPEQDVEEDYDD